MGVPLPLQGATGRGHGGVFALGRTRPGGEDNGEPRGLPGWGPTDRRPALEASAAGEAAAGGAGAGRRGPRRSTGKGGQDTPGVGAAAARALRPGARRCHRLQRGKRRVALLTTIFIQRHRNAPSRRPGQAPVVVLVLAGIATIPHPVRRQRQRWRFAPARQLPPQDGTLAVGGPPTPMGRIAGVPPAPIGGVRRRRDVTLPGGMAGVPEPSGFTLLGSRIAAALRCFLRVNAGVPEPSGLCRSAAAPRRSATLPGDGRLPPA